MFGRRRIQQLEQQATELRTQAHGYIVRIVSMRAERDALEQENDGLRRMLAMLVQRQGGSIVVTRKALEASDLKLAIFNDPIRRATILQVERFPRMAVVRSLHETP